MKRHLIGAMALGLSWSTLVTAQQGACRSPFNLPNTLSTDALRTAAASCDDAQLAELFTRRAEHRERMHELAILSQLVSLHGNTDRLRFQQSRIYTGLLEAFAQTAWDAGRRDSIKALTRGYEDAIVLLERAIEGRDLAYGAR